jgi:SAM-dependent methyltransferase
MTFGYGELAARVYALDKPVGTSFGDIEFYQQRLAGISGTILEPGTGAGRVLIPLLEAGFQVEGADNSAAMLEICRAQCQARGLEPVLHNVDMAEFNGAGRYAAVIIPAGTFALVGGREAAGRALGRMRESLVPGGRLILDLDPPVMRPGRPAMRSWRDGEDLLTLQVQHIDVDPVAQQMVHWLRCECWRDGGLVGTELQLFAVHWYGLEEFTAMLAETGFTNVTVCADYQIGAAPDRTSKTWVFEASRTP